MVRALIAAVAAGAIGFSSAPMVLAESRFMGPASPNSLDAIPASPVSQQNAVRSALEYLQVTGFSREGLIRQLVTIDGYSTTDATYAVDSISVDWNQQAVVSAQEYLQVTGFSREGLIRQLVTIDLYTPSQAAYGAAAVGL